MPAPLDNLDPQAVAVTGGVVTTLVGALTWAIRGWLGAKDTEILRLVQELERTRHDYDQRIHELERTIARLEGNLERAATGYEIAMRGKRE